MIKGAIFDLDGTLLDSMFIWDTIGEEYLRSLGKEPHEDLKETFMKLTLEEAAEYYREHYGVALSVNEIVDGVNEMVAKLYRTKVTLKDGVREFLEALKSQGVKMCVATVTDSPIVEDVLCNLGIRDFFTEIFTCAQVGYNKETQHIYRAALEVLGTSKEETVVFVDALLALMTAKNDVFCVAAVYDKHELRQTEMKENSDYYITNYETVKI